MNEKNRVGVVEKKNNKKEKLNEKKKELRWFTFYTSNSIDNNNW